MHDYINVTSVIVSYHVFSTQYYPFINNRTMVNDVVV